MTDPIISTNDQSWWRMPSSMTPDNYQRQMQGTMQQMRKQMAAIATEKDVAKRRALVQSHCQSMYRDMQMMRGMGWMWSPNSTLSLPEADSPGAHLVATYCSQCHAAPSPSLHTKTEWTQVTSRMREHSDQMSQANNAALGLKIPSVSELDSINAYLGSHTLATR